MKSQLLIFRGVVGMSYPKQGARPAAANLVDKCCALRKEKIDT
jgi:hypothetical protein